MVPAPHGARRPSSQFPNRATSAPTVFGNDPTVLGKSCSLNIKALLSRELVLVDQSTSELLRTATDQTLVARLQHAFEGLGYPWQGTTDPHENDFVTWIHGKSPLDAQARALLRARQRARTDKQSGAADDARDCLRELGIVVRDRDDAQQYRVVPHR